MPVIRIKRRATGGAAGAPANLAVGEPAYSEVDNILYIGVTGGTVVAMGGTGSFCTLTSAQTISGNKTFSGSVALGASATATTPSTNDSSTAVATTAYVRNQAAVSAATTSQTANSVWAAPNGSAGTPSFRALVAADIPTLTAAKISDFNTTVQANPLNLHATATGNYSMGGFTLTNLADPTNAQDAATKAYVDAARAGLDVKQSVRAATTANIALSGTQTIDNVVLVAGDRVLVKNQTVTTANGIYVVAAGAWSRASDANTGGATGNVSAGMFCFVEEGTAAGDSGWVLTADGVITLGTTALTFAQFSSGGVSGSYAGQTSITTLGTITTGTWNASVIQPTYGGTGLSSVLNGLVKGNGSTYSAASPVGSAVGATGDYLDTNSDINGGTF